MTSLQRFHPFREMRHFSRMMNHPPWTARWGDPMDGEVEHANESWSIPMDVRRDDKALTVVASLPGFGTDDLEVSISPDRILSVKASRQSEVTREEEEYLMRERRCGSFSRAIRLPAISTLTTPRSLWNTGCSLLRFRWRRPTRRGSSPSPEAWHPTAHKTHATGSSINWAGLTPAPF